MRTTGARQLHCPQAEFRTGFPGNFAIAESHLEGILLLMAGIPDASIKFHDSKGCRAHLQPGDNPASHWTFGYGYGYEWWISEDAQGDFALIGVWGQCIDVDPARGVVIVKNSADPLFYDNDHESLSAFRAIALVKGCGRASIHRTRQNSGRASQADGRETRRRRPPAR